MRKNLSVVGRLTIYMGILVIFILSVMSVFNYIDSKISARNFLKDVQKSTLNSTSMAYETYKKIKKASMESIAIELATKLEREEDIYDLLSFAREVLQFDSVFFGYDKTGKIYLSNGDYLDLSKNYDVTTRFWYKEAKATGHIVVTKPYISQSTGNAAIGYGVPVVKDGKVVGVVGGEYNLARYSKDILSVANLNDAYAAIYDKEGNIIFHEDAQQLLKQNALSTSINGILKANPSFLSEKTLFSVTNSKGVDHDAVCIETDEKDYVICTLTQSEIYLNNLREIVLKQVLIGTIAIVIALIFVRISIKKTLSPLSLILSGLNSFFDFL
ncbi:cache domain-containing protein, partial [Campylobacter sp.]|uniref:PDC sensor domain-containing protein n=1 Tax=Campylobacter sp. TaxID=205 RepID=UPI0026DCD22D